MRLAAPALAVGLALWAQVDAWWRAPSPPIITRPVIIMATGIPMAVGDPVGAWLEMDVDVLADVALGEDPWALAAVMWTVVNRAGCPTLPGAPCAELLEAVVRRGQAYGSVRRGRFRRSWSSRPGAFWARFRPRRWAEARERALSVLLGRVPDPTGGADHFHRRGTWRPPWAPDAACWRDVGRHHFYRVGASC